MRHSVIVVIAVACASALLALAPRPAPPDGPAAPPSGLVALVEYHPGNAVHAPPGGPVLAIWNDGTVIFSHNPCASENLQFGRIPRTRVEEVLTDLKGTGLLDMAQDWNIVPDGHHRSITIIRDGMGTVNRWNEALTVPWGAHIDAPREDRDFARAWMQARAILAFAQPSAYKPLKAGSAEDQRLEAAVKHLRSTPIR